MDEVAYFETVSEVLESWERVKRMPSYDEKLGVALFTRLFEVAPDGGWEIMPWTKADFDAKDAKFLKFAKSFVRMLDMAIDMLGPDLEIVEEQMYELGVSHGKYGVLPMHFEHMGKALDFVLQDMLQDLYKPSTKKAWTSVYRFITTTMIQGSVGFCR